MEEDEFDEAKKERVGKYRLMATIDNIIYKRFSAWCDSNGYDRSKMVELVIKKFMDAKGEDVN